MKNNNACRGRSLRCKRKRAANSEKTVPEHGTIDRVFGTFTGRTKRVAFFRKIFFARRRAEKVFGSQQSIGRGAGEGASVPTIARTPLRLADDRGMMRCEHDEVRAPQRACSPSNARPPSAKRCGGRSQAKGSRRALADRDRRSPLPKLDRCPPTRVLPGHRRSTEAGPNLSLPNETSAECASLLAPISII